MIESASVFVTQAAFMFFIDHKYRLLTDGKVEKLILFQGLIATMYVFIIPMVARGDMVTSVSYIAGAVAGTYLSYRIHKKGLT